MYHRKGHPLFMAMTKHLLPARLRQLIQQRQVHRHVDEQLPQYTAGSIPAQRKPSKS